MAESSDSATSPTLATSGTLATSATAAQPARHARLSELFSEAVSLSRTGRDALLERVRGEDSSLAAELVELLAADASAATALNTGGLHTPLERPANAPPLLSLRGYRVMQKLGQGGMGTVYAGEQESPHRRVAIKVLHVSSGPALARFYGEAEIMARLDHPGIARVLEAGEANGNPYIVMEHVDGMTLDMHVGIVEPPLAIKMKLFAAICDAVHHAHLNGVIHRDLKPKNVMVRTDGRVVVLDFGIARALAAPQPVPPHEPSASAASSQPSILPDESATRAGDLMGTPLYMSPEQAQLRAEQVDARSDVYSLGVVLHELVAGDLPYPIREAPLPIVSAIICEDPPASLHALGFDRDLHAIAQTALAKAPEARYQSAAALATDVRAWLDGRAVSVRALGTVESLRRYAKRRPLVAGGVLVGLGLVIAFAAITTHLWLEARAAQRSTETARASLQQRTATLLVQQARARVAADPTEAMALLADASEMGIDPLVFEVIAEEARGRGVAAHVLHGDRDEVHWVEELDDGALVAASGTHVRLWERPYATSRLLFTQQRGRIHLVRASPDGKLIAIGGDDGALHVVDRDGKLRGALSGHKGDIGRMAWSGSQLVTADGRGTVLGWNGGAAPARTYAGPMTKVQVVAFGERGEPIAGENNGKVWMWQLDGSVARSFAMRAAIRAVQAVGDTITVAAADGSVQRWRAGEPAGAAIETKIPTKSASISRDGRVVLLAGVDGSLVRVVGDRVENLGNHATKIRALAIDGAGRRIATGSEDGMIQVWDNATGRRITLRGHRQRIRHVEFSRSADTLFSSDGEGEVRVWPLETISTTFFHEHRAAVEHVAVGGDGRTVVSVDVSGEIVTTNLASGASRRVGQSPAHITAVGVAHGVPIVGDVKGAVTWWREERVERSVGSAVRAIAVSDDNSRVAVATADGPIALFDADGTPAGTLPGHKGGTDGLVFDRTGRLLASGGQDRHVRVWRDAAQLVELDGPAGDTHLLRFAPDNRALVSGCDDGAIRAWTMRDGAIDPKSRRVLGEHDAAVASLAFVNPTRVVSAARDGVYLLGDLATGTSVTANAPHRNAIVVAVAADGRLLFASESGDVDRWVPPQEPTTIPVSQGTSAAAPLPDGRIVLGGADGSLRIIGQRR